MRKGIQSIRWFALLNADRRRSGTLALIALLGWMSLSWFVLNTDPGETSKLLATHALNRLAFFAALFTGLFGTAALVAYYVTHHIYPLRRDRGDLTRALQEGAAIAATLTVLAVLRTVDMLTFLSAALVLIAGAVAFTYALTRK